MAATAGSLLSGCHSNAAEVLEISLLSGSVPAEVLKQFRQQTNNPVKFQTSSQLSGLFQQLQRWQSEQEPGFSLRQLLPWVTDPKQLQPDNLVSLDDYWLASAIDQDLIEPLLLSPTVLEKLPDNWLQSWLQFINRDVENQGEQQESVEAARSTIWAAPYRVQPLVIVYNQDKVSATDAQPFLSWQDLLNPALQDRIAMPEHPRLVLGLLQKIRSGSFNLTFESDLSSSNANQPTAAEIEKQLESQLGELRSRLDRQVKTYDGENSLKALINGDVDVAVSWLADIVAAQRRYRDLKMTIPAEGSLLSTDVWVRPKGADMSETASAWIDYCWQTGAATQISRSGRGLSPVFLGGETALPEAIANSLLSPDIIQKSEPLLPLSSEAQKAYFSFWQRG